MTEPKELTTDDFDGEKWATMDAIDRLRSKVSNEDVPISWRDNPNYIAGRIAFLAKLREKVEKLS